MDTTDLGRNIRGYRLKKKWSQARLGKAIKMDRANVSRIESGDTDSRFTTIVRVAKALGTPVKRLVEE